MLLRCFTKFYILSSSVHTQLRCCAKFYYSCLQHFFMIKAIKKSLRHWLRFEKVIKSNTDCHVFMDHCVVKISVSYCNILAEVHWCNNKGCTDQLLTVCNTFVIKRWQL